MYFIKSKKVNRKQKYWIDFTVLSCLLFKRLKGLFDNWSLPSYKNQDLLTTLKDSTQVTRKAKVKEFCKHYKNSKSKYFPKIVLVTDPEKSLAYCHVPKVASSAWMLIFAELNQNTFFRHQVPPFNKSSDHVFEELLESGKLHEMMLKNFSIQFSETTGFPEKVESFKFIFLRHPFERLVFKFCHFLQKFSNVFWLRGIITWGLDLWRKSSLGFFFVKSCSSFNFN